MTIIPISAMKYFFNYVFLTSDHIEHIKLVTGVDHVGIGSDFDGVGK